MPKSNVQHKFSLRRWLKPKLRKFQRRDTLAIYEINNLATVHGIARQSVGVPSQNPVRLAIFNTLYHFTKYRTAGDFGGLLLGQFLYNGKVILLGKSAQFRDLRFNTQNLLILHISGLAGV
ncbi:hypothetical protein IT415_03960 [bacterium]|nr:hypothetical protein [bacterium]